jgi:DNA-directed RNA polymerase subunit H (RpoH/RPB5)
MAKGFIKLGANGEKTPLVITLEEKDEKKLVPYGRVTSENEVDEITIKYQIVVASAFKNYTLKYEIASIMVGERTDLSHLFLFELPQNFELSTTSMIQIKIRMNTPNKEEYEALNGQVVKITLNFWLEKPVAV